MIFRQKVTALQRGEIIGEDNYGRPIYGPDVVVDFYGELRPLAGEENNDGREQVITRFRLFAPPRIALEGTDSISVDGLEYELVGHSEPHTVGGRLHHLEALVQRVEG